MACTGACVSELDMVSPGLGNQTALPCGLPEDFASAKANPKAVPGIPKLTTGAHKTALG